MPKPLPPWNVLKLAAAEHVDPAPTLESKDSTKGGVAHTAYRLACVCGHITVWSVKPDDAVSKWMHHLAIESGLKRRADHRKTTPGSHPRSL